MGSLRGLETTATVLHGSVSRHPIITVHHTSVNHSRDGLGTTLTGSLHKAHIVTVCQDGVREQEHDAGCSGHHTKIPRCFLQLRSIAQRCLTQALQTPQIQHVPLNVVMLELSPPSLPYVPGSSYYTWIMIGASTRISSALVSLGWALAKS